MHGIQQDRIKCKRLYLTNQMQPFNELLYKYPLSKHASFQSVLKYSPECLPVRKQSINQTSVHIYLTNNISFTVKEAFSKFSHQHCAGFILITDPAPYCNDFLKTDLHTQLHTKAIKRRYEHFGQRKRNGFPHDESHNKHVKYFYAQCKTNIRSRQRLQSLISMQNLRGYTNMFKLF